MEKLTHGIEGFRMGLLLFRDFPSAWDGFKSVPTQRPLKEQGYLSGLLQMGLSAVPMQCTPPQHFHMWLDCKFCRQPALGSSASVAIYQRCYVVSHLVISLSPAFLV